MPKKTRAQKRKNKQQNTPRVRPLEALLDSEVDPENWTGS